MSPHEVFSIEYSDWQRERLNDPVSHYWGLEFELADEAGASYCDLETCTEEDRSCVICGTINNTTDYGTIPYKCSYDKCRLIKDYWRISGDIDAFSHIKCEQSRQAWFRSRIKTTFNQGGTLASIPKELRFDFLLTAMIERIACEDRKDDQRAS